MFYDYSIEWLKVSDVMVLVPGWKKSKGTLAEIEVAKECGIPIFYNVEGFLEMIPEEVEKNIRARQKLSHGETK